MPYIITVNQPGYLPESSPTAVATIDEAIQHAHDLADPDNAFSEGDDWPAFMQAISNLPAESGGVIGPLPDGYVIDVQHITWVKLAQLALDAGKTPPLIFDTEQDRVEVIDAYNAGG